MSPKSPEITVKLTVHQLEALNSLLAYASAGGHEDVGMDPKAFNLLDSAWTRLIRARRLARTNRPTNGVS